MADYFEKFLNWLKTTPQYLFAISIICAILLFLKSDAIGILGLEEFRTENRTYIGIVFLISTALLASYPIKSLADWAKVWLRNYRQYRYGLDFLKKLSPEQKIIIQKFMDKNTRSMTLEFDDGNVKELATYGIIYLPHRITRLEYGRFTDYNMQPWAFDHLKKHPNLISKDNSQ